MALLCTALLVLEAGTGFLPDVTVLAYLTTPRLVLLVGLAAVLARDVAQGRSPLTPRPPAKALALYACVAALLAWQVLAAIAAPATSLPAIRLLIEQALAFGLVVLVIDDVDKLKSLGFVVLATVSAISLHALRQFTAGEITEHVLQWNGSPVVRVVGYFPNPNVFAAFLVLLLPLVVVLVWRAPLPSWLALLLIGVPGLALVLTFSRAALVGLLLAVGLVMTRRRSWLPLTVAVMAVMAVMNPLSTGRLLPGVASRVEVWVAALGIIAGHPLAGVGVGNFQAAAPRYWNAHNLYLHVAAESGVVAGLLLIAVLVLALWQADELSGRGGDAGAAGRAFSISILAFAALSMVDAPYNASAVRAAFWLVLGLLAAALRVTPARDLHRPRRAPTAALADEGLVSAGDALVRHPVAPLPRPPPG